jgi:hypothetical protein
MTRKERRLRKYVLKHFPDFYRIREGLALLLKKAYKSSETAIEKYEKVKPIIEEACCYDAYDESDEAINARLGLELALAITEVYRKKSKKDYEAYLIMKADFDKFYPFAINGYFTLKDVKKFVKGA